MSDIVERLEAGILSRSHGDLARTARDEILRLRAERDEAVSTLEAWFDLSKKAETAGSDILRAALDTWLRRASSGGMPSEHGEIVRSVVDDAARLYLWHALVPVLRTMTDARAEATEAERDRLRDALRKIDDTLTNMQPVIANGLLNREQLGYVDRYVDPAIQTARAALGDTPRAKPRRANHGCAPSGRP